MFTHGLLVDGRIWDRVAGWVAEQGFTVVLPDLPLGVPRRTPSRCAAATMRAAVNRRCLHLCPDENSLSHRPDAGLGG